MSDGLDKLRAERRAALLAARSGRPAATPVRTVVAALRPGMWVDTIPTQFGVRGVKVEAFVESVTPDWNTWRAGRRPVQSTRITFRGETPSVNVPDTFRVAARELAS